MRLLGLWCLRLTLFAGLLVVVFDFFAVVCLHCWLFYCGCSIYVGGSLGFALFANWGVWCCLILLRLLLVWF